MACESNQNTTPKRMREESEDEYLKLTTAEKWAANESTRVGKIQSKFFRDVTAKFENAQTVIEKAEQDVFAALNAWKARELKGK